MSVLARGVALVACALAVGCGRPAPSGDAGGAASATATAATAAPTLSAQQADGAAVDASVVGDAAAAGDASAELADAAPGDGGLAGITAGCPDGMVLVEGDYCPEVQQRCIEHHEEYAKDEAKKKKRADGEGGDKSTVSERCLRYAEPSVCLSKEKRRMRFCVDRYEYPNRAGEKPALLVSWTLAKKTCESQQKRLCTEDEFNFACEGEQMLPYTYGYVRDPEACNIDRPYRKRERKLYLYDRCMKKPACKAELEKLDQRLPSGSMPRCVSPFGVYDLNGNINEWVALPGKKYPDRSGLKGGWWGPVRGRCRPTVGFHKEDDYGYEEGFRCCGDPAK